MPEIVVSISLFALIMVMTGSVYLLSQKSYNKNSDMAELSQNARVSLDRISRELRQSVALITPLPATNTDPENPPPEQIIFQDGHDISQVTYIVYYLNGTDLMRQKKAYYFSIEPSTYVTYNSVDQSGQPPSVIIIEDRIVGEYFDYLNFWGENGLINISFELVKNQSKFNIKTSVYSRNW